MNEIWYRYEDVRVGGGPEEDFEDPATSHIEIQLRTFRVHKHTPKGVWLDTGQFVLKKGKKRYAHPTEAEAKESFIARKQSQVRILRSQLRRAEEVMALLTPKISLSDSLKGLTPINDPGVSSASVFSQKPPWYNPDVFDTRMKLLQEPGSEEDN